MEKEVQIKHIRDYVFTLFQADESGHDYFHMERVARISRKIAEVEQANVFLCEAAAWLHDVGDKKLFHNPNEAIEEMNTFLCDISLNKIQINEINHIISGISFSKGIAVPDTLEGRIVQDADRLDAIGAIGIARTFAFGGANQQLMYHPNSKSTSIQHFYDKLLTLKDLMHTESAREMAKERHQYMESFLKQFFQEW
ncbi:HD domain-containing protein [Oceanobacillus profundus]|uniref:HD domain-containing protein n=1 Tax=Oceanobacillus profundus TaxID=372463 RepID=A0A417YFZ1_9BACI|nr:HD domain-containing protein [Oceanobacillus profundus]MBR3120823.1 HD domain-containing protein [Oceanobacillus sp.]PAE29802.1 metal-dependent phosphohydrolase [Paenibacillus sp. 7884-2]MCM3396669.1 HD domain-containing protein [Oceanobacillus profundus]MDO6450763.1 HD domain-containing protein [Oceanobacillus profundus]RHW31626.1 HD domain-containing protein [Oceanobacillus profundus]